MAFAQADRPNPFSITMTLPRRLRCLLPLLALVFGLCFVPDARADGVIKTWTTAELVGAMRWAKKEAPKGDRLGFGGAELIAYKRLRKQIDAGDISQTAAFLITETVRKKGVYKGEKLTLERADELRRMIVAGRIFEKLTD
jgi:hypothetical protein